MRDSTSVDQGHTLAPPSARAVSARITWVDCAKGIGILLVVFGHNWRGYDAAGLMPARGLFQFVDDWIYSFHMPLFFMLAGMFAVRAVQRPAGTFFVERLKTLVYPYVLWSVLQGTFANLASGATSSGSRFEPVADLLYRPYAQFWFLYVLLICFLLFKALYALRLGVSGALLAAAAWYVTAPWARMGDWGVPYQVRYYFLFFVIGAASRELMLGGVSRVPAAVLAVVAVALYAVVALWCWRGTGGQRFDNNNPALPLIGIAASVALAAACDAWKVPLLARLGQLTLPIFLAHVLAAAGTRIVLQKVLHVQSLSAHVVAGMVAGVGAPVALYYASRRAGFPWLFSLRTEPRAGAPEAAAALTGEPARPS